MATTNTFVRKNYYFPAGISISNCRHVKYLQVRMTHMFVPDVNQLMKVPEYP
jgi:hypothetical protein